MELHKIEKFNEKLKLFCQLEKPMLDWFEFRDNDRLISDLNFPTQVYALNYDNYDSLIKGFYINGDIYDYNGLDSHSMFLRSLEIIPFNYNYICLEDCGLSEDDMFSIKELCGDIEIIHFSNITTKDDILMSLFDDGFYAARVEDIFLDSITVNKWDNFFLSLESVDYIKKLSIHTCNMNDEDIHQLCNIVNKISVSEFNYTPYKGTYSTDLVIRNLDQSKTKINILY